MLSRRRTVQDLTPISLNTLMVVKKKDMKVRCALELMYMSEWLNG